jgi:hypothetical protein
MTTGVSAEQDGYGESIELSLSVITCSLASIHTLTLQL